jgi:hypothetical protein
VQDLACVVHVHSRWSDGTGTVPQIMRAAKRAGVDVVVLTDHDNLRARENGQEGWHDGVLLVVGEEITPPENHFLAFGTEGHTRRGGRTPAEVVAAVEEAGGFGFAAHPFSEGSPLFRRGGLPYEDLSHVSGIEVWSFVNDTGEQVQRYSDVPRFVFRPNHFIVGPPERNLRAWDELNRSRRVVAVGGLDAHQIGLRIGPFVPLRLMSYKRSFQTLRTHVWIEGEVTLESVFGALREGRSYIAMDSLAPASGFTFEHVAGTFRATVPREARLRLLCDGSEVATATGRELTHETTEPGSYRLEAHIHALGRERTWILSNPTHVS